MGGARGFPWSTVATGVVLGAGAFYLLKISAQIPAGARLYPQLFLGAVLAGSAALVLQALWGRGRTVPGKPGAREGAESGGQEGSQDEGKLGWPLFAALVLYAFLLQRLGFLVSTFLFLAGVLIWLRGRVGPSVLLACAGALVIFVVFRTAMYVPLPAGPVDLYLLEWLTRVR